MTDNIRIIIVALIGGLLGWSLGKLLDSYFKGVAPYVVIFVMAILIIVMMAKDI